MSDADPAHAWALVRSHLRRAVPEPVWHLFLEPLELSHQDGRLLVVMAADDERDRVEARFGRLLDACAGAALGAGVGVELVARSSRTAETGATTPAPGTRQQSPAPPAADGAPTRAPTVPVPNPRLTFDQFVIGDSNRFAHAAALAVAEMPGLAYNPLFICGPPGLGKTHLLHSVAAYVEIYGDGLAVRCTTAEAFTDHFIGAVHGKATMQDFRAAYRDVDVLLVDDVQFLQSKARTEQEFFHTFNALLGGGAQLVLTSDRPPRNMDQLEDRLRERFEAGLVCDVRSPDLETRMTILRKRVLQDDLPEIEPAALALIADRIDANVRTLEGALIRVVAFGSLTGRPLDATLASEVLDDLYPDLRPRTRTVREIQERTCEAFGVSLDQMLSTSRAAPVTWPRQIAMYLSRELTDATLPAIGRAFGGRNHTTVLHAYRRTAARIADDADAFDAVQRLTAELKRGR